MPTAVETEISRVLGIELRAQIRAWREERRRLQGAAQRIATLTALINRAQDQVLALSVVAAPPDPDEDLT